MTIDRHVDKTKPRFTQLEKIPWEGEFLVNEFLLIDAAVDQVSKPVGNSRH